MVGIQGIGGTPEPRPSRSSGVRDHRPSPSSDQESGSDGVLISSGAQAAAALTRTLQTGADEVRAARVEAARQAIERGDYRRPDVVKVVAEKISRLL